MVSGLVKRLTVVAEIFFNFNSTEIKRSSKGLNPRKPAGPDEAEPLFLKIACDFTAECLCHNFNPTLAANKIPQQWRPTNVAPICGAGEPSILNYYRPKSNRSALEAALESLISELVKQYADSNNIVGESRPGFHK